MAQRPVRSSGTFCVYNARQYAWLIAPITIDNVRPSPLIVTPNIISSLLRLRVLRPLHYPRPRNEVSKVGTIEVGLHTTQVRNSCRK